MADILAAHADLHDGLLNLPDHDAGKRLRPPFEAVHLRSRLQQQDALHGHLLDVLSKSVGSI